MVTDRYQHIEHHGSVGQFVDWADGADIEIVGIDITVDSKPIETASLPDRCVLAFGQEGSGLSDEIIEHCTEVLHITQYGSTRSINVGVASGIAMYKWLLEHD
jgi:tRNA G18 (ribose-2'-O)-methylase SpoU